MSKRMSRRRFVGGAVAAALAPAAARAARPEAPTVLTPRKIHPVVVGSENAHPRSTTRAMELLRSGADPLDAVVAGINIVEDDPEDNSVGLGGLPNEEGVVELDASVMHGPSNLAGAVAALRNIRNPSSVARRVMEETDHVLLVGEGALRFAKACGFKEENLLTESSRRIWLWWRQSHSKSDKWREPKEVPPDVRRYFGITGTVHMSAVTEKGDLAGCTSTSGLAFKIPGRVGDSPIIGAGLYTDNTVGSAGSTGRGEANILVAGAHAVVENMRRGMAPKDACLEVIARVRAFTTARHLLNEKNEPDFQLKFYAVDRQGRHGGAALRPARYAVFDEQGPRLLDCAV